MADTAQITNSPDYETGERSGDDLRPPNDLICAKQSASFAVENMNCGGCMRKIERELSLKNGVGYVRANLSKKRVHVAFDNKCIDPAHIEEALKEVGFRAHQILDEVSPLEYDHRGLLRRVGVAGFAAANIMLLSVAVWAGLASDMDKTSMTLFHWLSALIALPVIAYAGQPFFSSAKQALAARHLNMDVPISLAVILATGMSLFQTIQGNDLVYFDASVTLLFFLLIGRYLDHSMRAKAESAAQNLMELQSDFATIMRSDGTTERLRTDELVPGMVLLVARGENIPADGIVRDGATTVNEALLTGESRPRAVSTNDKVFAGTINLMTPVRMEVTSAKDDTTLSEISRLMAVAEQARGRYVRLADRAAAIYAPGIHLIGALTFFGWLGVGAGWEHALLIAISVLIITCPCALALAVPAVQVAAASQLFKYGMILKSGDGLERLAEIDYVVLDKTGTLTLGAPELQNSDEIDDVTLSRAASLAGASRHPYSRAIVDAAEKRIGKIKVATNVVEEAGHGLMHIGADGVWKLGSASWCGVKISGAEGDENAESEHLWLSGPQEKPVCFKFEDVLRPDAVQTIAKFNELNLPVELLSGDGENIVRSTAQLAGINNWSAEVKPSGKIERLHQLKAKGHHVLMVGDGLNDAPALSAGHASIAPSSAADISKTAADVILQGQFLSPIIDLINIAKKTRILSLQNFALAAGYNVICIPLAVAGYVTPLIAAIAMSTSSIVVTANALRLHMNKKEKTS